MPILATTLLLASSLALSSTGHLETNLTLRTASVDHDLAKVKRRIERNLHNAAAAAEPAGTPDAPAHLTR